MGLLKRALLALAVLALFSFPASASIEEFPPTAEVGDSERVALVIGNGDYTDVAPLVNTERDAMDVASKLPRLGFRTLLGLNLDRRAMNDALDRFLASITPGAEALVYYSGHGVELQGANYLIPIDVPKLSGGQERLLKSEGVNLGDLLLDLQSRGARVSLVLLDACRDNPFTVGNTKTLGGTRGLARVEPPQGSFVIYSAGVGEQALDSLGPTDTSPNGVFTRELLQLLDKEGLELREMVFTLRDEVRTAALSAGGHSQIPSYYDQLFGRFYFLPPEAASGSPTPPSSETINSFAPTSIADEMQPPAEIALFDPGTATESLSAPQPPAVLDQVVLGKALQSELQRLGCYHGAIDGIWGPGSNRALSDFARLASVDMIEGSPAASFDLFSSLLDNLKSRSGRVCPLHCGVRYEVEGNECVLKTCPSNQRLGHDGICRIRQANNSGSAPPRASGGNCFSFNGKQVCE